MPISEQNRPFIISSINSYFIANGLKTIAKSLLDQAPNEEAAVTELIKLANANIFSIPLPSDELQNILDRINTPSSAPSFLQTVVKNNKDITALNTSLIEMQAQLNNTVPNTYNFAVVTNGKVNINVIPDLSGIYLKTVNNLVPIDAIPSNIPNTTLIYYAGLDHNWKIPISTVPDLPNNVLSNYAALTNGLININVIPDLSGIYLKTVNNLVPIDAIPSNIPNTTLTYYAGLDHNWKIPISTVPDLPNNILSNYAALTNGLININVIPDLSGIYLKTVNNLVPIDAIPSNIPNTTLIYYAGLDHNWKIPISTVPDLPNNVLSNYAALTNGLININVIPDLSGIYLKTVNNLVPIDAIPSNIPNTTLIYYAGLDENWKIPLSTIPDLPNSFLTHYAALINGKISANVIPDIPNYVLTHYAALNGQGKINANVIPDVSNTTFSRYAGLNEQYQVDQSVIPDLDANILTHYAALDDHGKISISVIPNLPREFLTHYAALDSNGKVNATVIPDVSNTTFSRYAGLDDDGHIPLSTIPNMPANKISSGTFDVARIPRLDASIIDTYGNRFSPNQIPVIDQTSLPLVYNTGNALAIYGYIAGFPNTIDSNMIVDAQTASAHGISKITGNCALYIFKTSGVIGFCSSSTDSDACTLTKNNDHLATCIGLAMNDLS